MAEYAILGATGNTGQCLLKLLDADHRPIRALVRSEAKLRGMSPEICAKDNVQIFQGSIDDTQVLKDCLRDTKAVFLVIASNENLPGLTLAEDTAKSVLAALRQLKEENELVRLPRLIVLSSASTSDHLMRSTPRFMHQTALLAFSNIYGDLRKAESLLRASSDLVATTFIKPGGLVHDIQRGHRLSTDEAPATLLSFVDLAAGMIEVADAEGETWDMKNVTVVSTTGAGFSFLLPFSIIKGLLYHFFPAYCHFWRRLPSY